MCSVFVERDISFYFQGGWEDDETLEEAACREALEEAGVKGKLNVSYFRLLHLLLLDLLLCMEKSEKPGSHLRHAYRKRSQKLGRIT